jgi:hypothetical protein
VWTKQYKHSWKVILAQTFFIYIFLYLLNRSCFRLLEHSAIQCFIDDRVDSMEMCNKYLETTFATSSDSPLEPAKTLAPFLHLPLF